MFNFKTLVKSEKHSEPKVFVDSGPFNTKQSYRDVKELLIEDKQGKIKIENCKISNLKANEFAEIKRYSVYFHEKLKKLNQEKQNFFIKTTIQVELFNIPQEELELEELTNYLVSLDAIRKIPEKQSSLVFTLNTFQDIDLNDFFSEYRKQKSQILEQRKEQPSNAKLELNAENLQRLKQINFGEALQGAKKFKDENGNENFYSSASAAGNNLDYVNKPAYDKNKNLITQQQNFNLFENKNLNFADALNFSKNKPNRAEESGGFANVFDFSNEVFIPFEDQKYFDFQYNTAVNPNPYKLPEKKDIKKYAKSIHIYGLKPAFNQFGEFITIGKFNSASHSFALNINKLIPNKSLITDRNLKLVNFAEKANLNKAQAIDSIKIVNNEDEKMIEFNEMSIDDASSRTDDYANAKVYNRNLIGFSSSAAPSSNKTSNYEAALLQEYPVQTICSFLELVKSKLKQIHKDRNFIEDINKLNINSKKFNLNKNEHLQPIDKMDIEGDESFQKSPRQAQILDKQFLKALLMNRIDDCLDVADYTKIAWDYLIKLMKAKDKFSQVYKCDLNTEVILNIEKEISTLKLFIGLFLNCFYDLKQLNNVSYTNNFANNISKNFLMLNFSHSILPETQRLRKKKLLDWLVYDCRNATFIEEQLNEKAKKIVSLEKKEAQNNLYELIFYCLINGRIKKALELTDRFNLFNLSGLISQFYMNNSLNNIRCFKEQILKETWQKQNNFLNYIYEILSVESAQSAKSRGVNSNSNNNAFAPNTNINLNANNGLRNASNSLFGNNANQNQTGVLFGNAAASNQHAAGGLFGHGANANQNGGGMFGNAPAVQQGSSLLGVVNPSQNANTTGTGLLGNPPSGGNLFGQSTGLFANASNQANQSGNLFSSQQQIAASPFANVTNNMNARSDNNNNALNLNNRNPNFLDGLGESDLFYNEDILKNLNWKQFFICNGLYIMKANKNIDDMLENYSAVVKNQGKKYQNINSFLATNNCQDLNMLLLEYYTMIQKNKKYDEEFLNQMFLQKNIFSKFSDLHLHFIICTILLNTLTETYSGNTARNLGNDLLTLKKIQHKLLVKLTEDLLIQGNILAAVNLILISNLSNGHKFTLVEELIYKFINTDNIGLNLRSSNLKIFEHINAKATYDSLGLRSLSQFDIEKALKHFKSSENFEKLHEVILNYF